MLGVHTVGWIVLSTRRNELLASTQELQNEILQLSSDSRKLSSFSSAIADGSIDPSEMDSISGSLFEDVLGFMNESAEYANDYAYTIGQEYADQYSNITQQQYYNNSGIASGATLYFDEDGNLDIEKIYNELYEQGLKDYAETYVKPQLSELEEIIQQEKTEKETLLQQEEAELETIKQSISQQISNSTIQLS